ncbi:MAG: hypothetical protein INH41_06830 [Myxococcaceae bacterium]|nr:hypothetical protein [Myxococcaceae bacterium]
MTRSRPRHHPLLLALFCGCYVAEPLGVDGPAADGGLSGPTAGGAAGGGGVPCEVSTVLAQRCLGCHGSPPAAAPMSLSSAADFRAIRGGQEVRALSLSRLRDPARPMPPSGVLPAAELSVLEGWLQAGVPEGLRCTTTAPVDAGAPVVDAGASAAGDLPCDVEAVIATSCRGCHGARPVAGAPMPLVSRAHFLAPAPSSAGQSTGAMAVRRMKDAAAPMPVAGLLNPTQVAVVEAWVQAGMPPGQCGAADAGAGDPFSTPVQCTSGTTWTRGNRGSPLMNPGRACLSCHARVNADKGEAETPDGIGGTVYPSAHEPDLCNGLPGGAVVVVRGANGVEFRLPVNAAGNFFMYDTATLRRPFTARVEFQGRVRRMQTPQQSGDCNGCHTEAGAQGAPGRVLAP